MMNLCYSPITVEKMPFRKHRGDLITDLPHDYVNRFLGNIDDLYPDPKVAMQNVLR